MSIRETQAFKIGRSGEELIRHALEELGWHVIPLNCIEQGGAPSFENFIKGRCSLPDLQAFKDGKQRFVEVKTKSCPVQYNKTGFWRHGCDLRNWNAYLRGQQISGVEVYMAIYELRPQKDAPINPHWYLQTIDQLARNVQIFERGHATARSGMVYWNVDEFDPQGPIAPLSPDIAMLKRKAYAWAESKRSLDQQQRSFL